MLTAREHLDFLIQGESTKQFRGTTREEFMGWRTEFVDWLQGLLDRFESGRHNVTAPPEIAVESEDNDWHGVKRTDIRFINPEYGLEVTGSVLEPPADKRNGSGVVCQHGHGPYGRVPIIGDDSTPELKQNIAVHNYDNALKLAQAGYTTVAIDLYNFGCRELREKGGRDRCDIVNLGLSQFGMHPIPILVRDIRMAITVLQGWPGVDAGRIGMYGLSLGGRMTMLVTALDERIKAAVSSGANNTYRDRIALSGSTCGIQIVAGLLPHADTPEIFSSIAPRPLQIQWGDRDDLIVQEPAERGHEYVSRCYAAAGVPERYETHRFEGGHVFDVPAALRWFEKWL